MSGASGDEEGPEIVDDPIDYDYVYFTTPPFNPKVPDAGTNILWVDFEDHLDGLEVVMQFTLLYTSPEFGQAFRAGGRTDGASYGVSFTRHPDGTFRGWASRWSESEGGRGDATFTYDEAANQVRMLVPWSLFVGVENGDQLFDTWAASDRTWRVRGFWETSGIGDRAPNNGDLETGMPTTNTSAQRFGRPHTFTGIPE